MNQKKILEDTKIVCVKKSAICFVMYIIKGGIALEETLEKFN